MKPKGSKRTLAAKKPSLMEKQQVSNAGELHECAERRLIGHIRHFHWFYGEHKKHKGTARDSASYGGKKPLYSEAEIEQERQWLKHEAFAAFTNAIVNLDEGFFERCLASVRACKQAAPCDRNALAVLNAVSALAIGQKFTGKISSEAVAKWITQFQEKTGTGEGKFWRAKDIREIAAQLGMRFPLDAGALWRADKDFMQAHPLP